mgnify:CR=1 FL=1
MYEWPIITPVEKHVCSWMFDKKILLLIVVPSGPYSLRSKTCVRSSRKWTISCFFWERNTYSIARRDAIFISILSDELKLQIRRKILRTRFCTGRKFFGASTMIAPAVSSCPTLMKTLRNLFEPRLPHSWNYLMMQQHVLSFFVDIIFMQLNPITREARRCLTILGRYAACARTGPPVIKHDL